MANALTEDELFDMLHCDLLLDNNHETDIEDDYDSDGPIQNNCDDRPRPDMFDCVFDREVNKCGQGAKQIIYATNEHIVVEDSDNVSTECVLDNQEHVTNGSSVSGTISNEGHPTTSANHSDEPCRKWKKLEKSTEIPDYGIPEGINHNMFASCNTASDVYLELVRDALEGIVYQSNLYGTQNNKNICMTTEELYVFLGINMIMGYHVLPAWKDYWSGSQDLGIPLISKSMSRNRFDTILCNLHVNDNSKIPLDNQDKVFKLKPMIESLNYKFDSAYEGSRQLSVDETMVVFKGRSSMKQYNPKKPIKRGFKIWTMADMKGYVKKFRIYQGKDEILEQEFKNYSLGERVVLHLTKTEWGKSRMIFFDNYFTSLTLLERLKTENTLACGTIRINRKGLPQNMTDDKKLKRGDSDYRISNTGLSVFKWKDTKCVWLASNYHGTETTSVLRKEKDGKRRDVTCPTVVDSYNSYMGGVDLADRLRTVYGIDRRCKKWWHRLFWAMLEIAFINSYVIFCKQFEQVSLPLIQFRRDVALGLLTYNGPSKRSSNKRRSTDKSPVTSKRRGKTYSVSKDMRLGNRGVHFPLFVETRGRCELCSMKKIQSRPYCKCRHCGVYLCCNEKKNCFIEYHDIF